MNDAISPLLTDLYQLNMIQAYLDHGQTETAVFEFFVRALPSRRQFLMAAGLEQALDFLQGLHFSADDLDWLARSGRFGKGLIDYLAGLRFTGDVHAMPEGTVFFANEPILRVTAPLPQAQLVETRLINLLHFQTLVASKAARSMLAAPGKLLVDFGLRRAHGAVRARDQALAHEEPERRLACGFERTEHQAAKRRMAQPPSGLAQLVGADPAAVEPGLDGDAHALELLGDQPHVFDRDAVVGHRAREGLSINDPQRVNK